MTDYHNDFILHLNVKQCEEYLNNTHNLGIKCIYTSIWTTKLTNPMLEIKSAIAKIKSLKTKVELKIHIEDLGFLNEQNIEEFFLIASKSWQSKPTISSCGLTWNYNNAIAGGSLEDGNLTEFGKIVIKRLVQNNIKIDLAHLNRKSFYSVFKFLKTSAYNRVLCSHTCFNNVCRHKRNLTKKQIELIIKNNGVIGLTLIPNFLSKNKTTSAKDAAKHINYFKDNFNINYLKIGTDYFGNDEFPNGLETYENLVEFWKNMVK